MHAQKASSKTWMGSKSDRLEKLGWSRKLERDQILERAAQVQKSSREERRGFERYTLKLLLERVKMLSLEWALKAQSGSESSVSF